jgi:hypothetical protein
MKINDLNNIRNEINTIKLEDTGNIIRYLNKRYTDPLQLRLYTAQEYYDRIKF